MDLNDTVTVTLTHEGADFLNKRNNDLNEKFNDSLWWTGYKEGDDFQSQLYDIMHKFGPICQLGMRAAFKNLRLK